MAHDLAWMQISRRLFFSGCANLTPFEPALQHPRPDDILLNSGQQVSGTMVRYGDQVVIHKDDGSVMTVSAGEHQTRKPDELRAGARLKNPKSIGPRSKLTLPRATIFAPSPNR